MDFDAIAKDFDTQRRMRRAEAIAEAIRARAVGFTGKAALEYGCGTGLVGLGLLHAFASVTFMDFSPGMIDEVRKKTRNLPNTRAVVCDLAEDGAKGLRVDCIFTSMVLHHIRDTRRILARFCEMLNEGGRLIVVDLDSDDGRFHASETGFDGHNGFDQQEFSRSLREAGFRDIGISTFYHGEKEIGGKPAPYSLFIARCDK